MHEILLILRSARRQGEPAVTGDHCGNSVPGRRGAQRIPEDLGVIVGVKIDEPRSNDQVRSVDHPFSTISDFPHCSNLPVRNGYISTKPRGASAIHDSAVFNEQIVRHRSLLFRSTLQAILRPLASLLYQTLQ